MVNRVGDSFYFFIYNLIERNNGANDSEWIFMTSSFAFNINLLKLNHLYNFTAKFIRSIYDHWKLKYFQEIRSVERKDETPVLV